MIADLQVDDPSLLDRAEPLQRVLVDAAERAGMTVLAGPSHQFEPHGATVVLLLAQSHLAIHTWPEEGIACVDLMTCGGGDPQAVLDAIREALPGEQEIVTMEQRSLAGLRQRQTVATGQTE